MTDRPARSAATPEVCSPTSACDGVSRDPALAHTRWRVRGPFRNRSHRPMLALAPSGDVSRVRSRRPGKTADRRSSTLRKHIGDCTRCKLHTLGRRQVVFGVGNPQRRADVRRRGARRGRRHAGRAVRRPRRPAADEDHRGDRPHTRRRLHRERDQVPPARQPQSGAGRSRDLPAVSVRADRHRSAHGSSSRSARSRRTRCSTPTRRSRGCGAACTTSAAASKLIPTFHPAFLLRSPERKRDVWEDMKKVRALLAERRLSLVIAVAVPVPGSAC